MPVARSKAIGAPGGAAYYDEQLKQLYQLLKKLPIKVLELRERGNKIKREEVCNSKGTDHDFTNYIPDPDRVDDTGNVKCVVNRDLEVSFGVRQDADGNRVVVRIKSRGLGLQNVVEVLRGYITGDDVRIIGEWNGQLDSAKSCEKVKGNTLKLSGGASSLIF
ncbi:unnamed protein product [Mycena citricolor]|uniref:Uncharacterized protein n=1 Tax=Mycena citricolor TaxID=2018698 RepID=A0AAD2Q485_9AGAR|nr:unnamed protein product [Mycena citricolor]